MSEFSVVPVEGESYEGRQYGWMIRRDDVDILHCVTGGTGDCWNLNGLQREDFFGPLGQVDDHICDLDEFIKVLIALRDSDAHRENVERWRRVGS